MRVFLVVTAIIVAFTSAGTGVLSQGKPTPSSLIVGVWRGTSTVVTGTGARANPNRHPNVFIYTKNHYAFVAQDGQPPKPIRQAVAPPKDPNNLTDAEKLALYELWEPLGAQAGTYEVTGNTVVDHPILEKNVPPRSRTYTLEFIGNDTMVQSATSADGKSELRRTYTRVE
jgi:hypothetical protein